jgi:hypothetical protein
MLMDAHFVAVRRAGSRAGGRAPAGEELDGERARQRPDGVCSRRASAGGVEVAEGGWLSADGQGVEVVAVTAGDVVFEER